MNKTYLKLTLSCLLLASVVLAYYKKSEISGYWYFSAGLFKVIEISMDDRKQLLVELAVPADYAQMNVMAYRQCPYQDDVIWSLQATNSFTVVYYRLIAKHEVINPTYADVNAALASLKNPEASKPKYAEIARTICDNKWSEEREISSLLMLPLSN